MDLIGAVFMIELALDSIPLKLLKILKNNPFFWVRNWKQLLPAQFAEQTWLNMDSAMYIKHTV